MVTKNNGNISFTYNVKTLFDEVGLISSYMTKNLVNEQGSVMDEFVMSEDDNELFDMCVKQTTPNIFEGMLKMAAFVKGFDYKDNTITFSINDNDSYNENTLSLVDSTILECLKYGVLSEYYLICTNASLQSLANKKYAEAMLLLNQRMFQLKKKAISSLY